jgi:sugar phosphate isomerase/epimerase
LLEHLSPDVFLEIDTYWVKTAGVDPAAVLREIGRRAPLLHIKDGPAVQEAPMTAVGAGVLDWPAVAEASSAEWWIVELDRCATDIWEALQQSYTYLTGMRFVRGKR